MNILSDEFEDANRCREILQNLASDISVAFESDSLKCVKCKTLLKTPRHLPCYHLLCTKCYSEPSATSNAKAKKALKNVCPVEGCGKSYDFNNIKSSLDTNLGRAVRFFDDLKTFALDNSASDSGNLAPLDCETTTAKENVEVTTSSTSFADATLAFKPLCSNVEAVVPPKQRKQRKSGASTASCSEMDTYSETSSVVSDDIGKTKRKRAATDKGAFRGKSKKILAAETITSVAAGPSMTTSITEMSDKDVNAANLSEHCETTVHSNTPTRKANKEKRNAQGETALQRACKMKNGYNKVKTLLENGANPSTADNAGWTPLHEAAQRGYAQILEELIAKGANVNVKSLEDGITPLHDAVTSQSLAAVQVLLKAGASAKIPDFRHSTALDLAKKAGAKDIIEALLRAESAPGLDHDQTMLSTTAGSELDLPITYAMSGFSSDEQTSYERSLKRAKLPCNFASLMSRDVTHLVVEVLPDDPKVCALRRSLKYLQALTFGCWIVSTKWLDDSVAAGQLLPEEDYEVEGCGQVYPHVNAPKRSRMGCHVNKEPRLFASCGLFFQGPFRQPLISSKDLRKMAESLGAIVLKREPRYNLSLTALGLSPPPVYHATEATSPIRDYCVFIIRDPVLSPAPHQINSPPLCTVTYDWFLTCIETWKLNDIS